MLTRGFLVEILLQRHIVEQTDVISVFLFTFITHKQQDHLVGHFLFSNIFSNFFHDYDILTEV